MFNQLLKITLFTSAWMWLKPRWRGLLAIIVFLLLVNILHREYLDYVSISEDRTLLIWSYVIKWGLVISGLLVYFLSGAFWSRQPSAREPKTQAGTAKPQAQARATGSDDGFDFLRKKKKLQAPADKLLDRK